MRGARRRTAAAAEAAAVETGDTTEVVVVGRAGRWSAAVRQESGSSIVRRRGFARVWVGHASSVAGVTPLNARAKCDSCSHY